MFVLKPDLNVLSSCDVLAGDRNVKLGMEICEGR